MFLERETTVVSESEYRSATVTAVVAAASVTTVGVLSPIPSWVTGVATVVVAVTALLVGLYHRPSRRNGGS
jgi:hypothetical protein